MPFLLSACSSTIYRDAFQFTAQIIIDLEEDGRDMIAVAPLSALQGQCALFAFATLADCAQTSIVCGSSIFFIDQKQQAPMITSE